MKQKATITEQVRQLILDSGLSSYRLHQETGVQPSAITRFLHGERGLTTESLDRLAPIVGFQVVATPTAKKTKGK